jgi:hypothetical protein
MKLSLPTDSAVRKTYPLFGGLFGYFGAALAGVANHSWKNNEKHNPGQPLHWSVDKSTDHADCIARHLLDLGDMEQAIERGDPINGFFPPIEYRARVDALLAEADALAWRALALNQTLRQRYAGAPLPFNARRSEPEDEIEIRDVEEARAFFKVGGYPAQRCVQCKMQPCDCAGRRHSFGGA